MEKIVSKPRREIDLRRMERVMLFGKNTPKNLGLGFLIVIGLLVIFAVVVFLSGDAEAAIVRGYHSGNIPIWDESTHPPRAEVRLDMLGNDLSPGVETLLQGVCYDVLEKEDKPFYLYFGMGFQRGNLKIQPAVGWSFRDNEWVLALRTYPKWERWRGYSNVEYQLETKSWYYLGQIETHINDWVEWGVEVEGWGDIDDHMTSNGAGLNVVFNTRPVRANPDAKIRIEAGIQWREMGDKYKPQVLVRFIFTPKMEAHSPNIRRR